MREISLSYLLNIAWKRIWILAAVFIVTAGIAFGYCKLIASPKYAAKASILVTNGGMKNSQDAGNSAGSVSNSDISASVNMVTTVVDILKTDDIYKQLSADFGGDYTYSELLKNASVEARGEKTMFIDVTFTASSESEALKLVNSFAELAPEYISDSIPNSYTKYYAAEKAAMTYPTTLKTTVIFAIFGVAAAYMALLLIDVFDRGIKSEADYVSRFDIPLIGIVPDFESANNAISYSSFKGGNSK